MKLETEAVLDRRNLRRRISFWRALALVAGVLAIGGIGYSAGDPGQFGKGSHIARVAVEGMITEDRDQLKLLMKIAEDKSAEAVILFVNSPGGTTSGGEALFQGIRTLAEKKPVVAQFGTVAASAAFIAGLATDHIVARGNTITGSVGVIFQYPEVSELLGKLGVKMNEIRSGPLKATPSMFQPLDPAGRQLTEQIVAEGQRWFVGLVATRRNVTTASIPGLEQGRVFSGREAMSHRLVDEIGGEPEAQRWLEDKRGVKKGLKVVDWKPKRDSDWSWTRIAGEMLGSIIGSDETLRALGSDSRLASLRLDGLLSIWHPGEK